jgi:hypothetical protein
MSAHYQTVEKNMLGAHSLYNGTQYYQQVRERSAISRTREPLLSPTSTLTRSRPLVAQTDTAGACIADSQLQAEIKKVMALKKWTGGSARCFFVFTSSGEGPWFDSTSSSCAYAAYHGYFLSGTTPVVSANVPYGDLNNCQVGGTLSPNSDPVADAAATSASHEFT